MPLSLAMLWHGKLQLPSKGPGTARVFHFCVADLPLFDALRRHFVRQAKARIIARKSACQRFGLSLGRVQTLPLQQQDVQKGLRWRGALFCFRAVLADLQLALVAAGRRCPRAAP